MDFWLAGSMPYETTDITDGLGNEGTRDKWEKKKKKLSASSPEEDVNQSELYFKADQMPPITWGLGSALKAFGLSL